jgi:RNA recognition motif-containing protein
LSVQVIQRGTRSAGYGFVSVKDTAQVENAVAELNKKDLDGRSIIVEAAKPAEDKERERSQRRNKKRAAGRRGNKAPPGEVTEAEANGEAPESTSEIPTGEDKSKKRTKKPVSLFYKSLGLFC